MKVSKKSVPLPQEREEEHKKDIEKFGKEIEHSKEKNVVKKRKQLLLDNKNGGGE